MTRPPAPPSPVLPCGRDLLALVEQVTDGRPPADPEHQRTCPHCQEALARLRASGDALRGLAAQPVEPPRGLADRVLGGLRREGPGIVVSDGPGGRDEIASSVLCRTARVAALEVDGVRAASVVAEARDEGVVLDVHVVAAIDRPLPELAERLREAVAAHVAAVTGVRVRAVDVAVDDVA